jgi:hypothetical protein
MDIKNMKLPIGVIGLIIAQAFGIIWYVAQLDSTVGNNTTAIESFEEYDSSGLEEAIEDLEDRIAELETTDKLIQNEFRTIMADHSSFSDVLKDMGKSGYGDTRDYGNYE